MKNLSAVIAALMMEMHMCVFHMCMAFCTHFSDAFSFPKANLCTA